MKATIQEKRQFPRKSVDLPLMIAIEGGSGTIPGTARDLSIGGMFVLTQARAPFGTRIKVLVDVPGTAGTLTIQAVVRWTAPDGLGVQFGQLGARETHAIAQVLSKAKVSA